VRWPGPTKSFNVKQYSHLTMYELEKISVDTTAQLLPEKQLMQPMWSPPAY